MCVCVCCQIKFSFVSPLSAEVYEVCNNAHNNAHILLLGAEKRGSAASDCTPGDAKPNWMQLFFLAPGSGAHAHKRPIPTVQCKSLSAPDAGTLFCCIRIRSPPVIGMHGLVSAFRPSPTPAPTHLLLWPEPICSGCRKEVGFKGSRNSNDNINNNNNISSSGSKKVLA